MGSNLDVALRLRLINGLHGPAAQAAKDIDKIGAAGKKLVDAKVGARFSADFGKAWLASAKLNQSLNKTEREARGAGAAMRQIAADSHLVMARRRVEQLDRAVRSLTQDMRAAAKLSRKIDIAPAVSGGGAHKRSRQRGAFGEEFLNRTRGLAGVGGFADNAYLLGAGRMAIGGAAAGAGVALAGYGGYKSVKESISRDKAMADVKKKVNLDEGATWGDVEGMIGQVSRDLGLAYEKTAELTATAGQAGIAYKDLAEFVRLAAKTSSAWDISPKEAAQQMAQVKAMTQWTNKQIEDYADKVNALGDSSASAEKDIAEMFKRSAGAAKAAGVDFDTTLAVTTALNSIGMQEEVASRFFNSFTSKLRTATDGTKKAQEGFKMLGLSAQQVEKGMKRDAQGTIIDFLSRLEKHPDKAKIAVKIMGLEWWDEATRGGQAIPEMRKNAELMRSGKWKGSLAQNLGTDLATTQKHLERTKAVVAEIGDRIGRWALPPLNASLQALIDKYDAWVKTSKTEAEARAIVEKAAVGGSLSDQERERLRSDPALLDEVERQREKIANDPEARREKARNSAADAKTGGLTVAEIDARLEALRAKIEKAEAVLERVGPGGAGVGVKAAIGEMSREIDALDRRRNELQPRPAPLPQARPADLPDPNKVEELKNKLLELDRIGRAIKIAPDETLKDRARALVADLTAAFQSADLSPAAKKVMDSYVTSIGAEGGKVGAEAQKIRSQLEAILGAPIVVKIEPRVTGSMPAGVPPGGGKGASAAKGKHSSRGGMTIQTAHFHGVRDLGAAHRQASALVDRNARDRVARALHDVDVGDTA